MSKNYSVFLPENNAVCYRFWDNECVIYHQSSAQTHLIDEPGCSLFKAIIKRPFTRFDLLAHLAGLFEFSPDIDLEALLDTLVIEYQTLGLVEITEARSL